MNKTLHSVLILCAALIVSFPMNSSARDGSAIIKSYEQISDALASDDLAATQKAAGELVDQAGKTDHQSVTDAAKQVAQTQSLEKAREQFVLLSKEVIALSEDKDGYFVFTCPMVENGEWLQSDTEMRNPYMGQKMLKCGHLKSEGDTSGKTKSSSMATGCCPMRS